MTLITVTTYSVVHKKQEGSDKVKIFIIIKQEW